jgi:hypothetical protein
MTSDPTGHTSFLRPSPSRVKTHGQDLFFFSPRGKAAVKLSYANAFGTSLYGFTAGPESSRGE